MSELSEGWTTVSLKELFEFKYGKGLIQEQRNAGGPVSVYGSNGIVGKHDKALTRGTSIVVGRKGSVGEVHLSKDACWPIDTTYFIDSFPASFPPEYWAAYLKFLRLGQQEKSSAIPGISRDDIYKLEVPVPPLNEQRRIVEKLGKLLSHVDAAQVRLATIPHILKRFRQSVLAAACSGKLTADWREKHAEVESGSDLIKRIRRAIIECYERESVIAKRDGTRKPKTPNVLLDSQADPSELPDLPPKWSWSYLQNLGEFTRGKSKHRPRNDPKLYGGEYPFIQTGDISRSNGRIVSHLQTYNKVGLAQSRLFPSGTLCITIAANIAETAILSYPTCFPDSVVGFIPEEGLFEARWAMYFVRIAQNDLETFAPATAQKNINMDILFKVAVPVPPLAEQQEIVHRVEALFKTADALEARYRTAKAHIDKLTQSILAKAFRGELVPQDPKDEPASVLLARISQAGSQSERKPKRPRSQAAPAALVK